MLHWEHLLLCSPCIGFHSCSSNWMNADQLFTEKLKVRSRNPQETLGPWSRYYWTTALPGRPNGTSNGLGSLWSSVLGVKRSCAQFSLFIFRSVFIFMCLKWVKFYIFLQNCSHAWDCFELTWATGHKYRSLFALSLYTNQNPYRVRRLAPISSLFSLPSCLKFWVLLFLEPFYQELPCSCGSLPVSTTVQKYTGPSCYLYWCS